MLNVCHYIAECCEDEFISAAGGSGLTFSSSIPTIETISMTNDIGINISRLRILLRSLRQKIDAKLS